MLCGFFIARHYGLAVAGSDAPGVTSFSAEYIKPYVRCGTYLIGLLCGMILYSKHHYEKTGKVYDPLALWFAKIANIFYIRWFFYCVGAVLINIFIFLEYRAWDKIPEYGHDDWSNEARWFWKGCSRQIWILGFAFLILPLLLGHGLLVRKFLSAGFWTPLARLSFSVYLIHYSIIVIL